MNAEQQVMVEQDSDEIDLWDLFATVMESRWLILSIAGAVTFFGLAYALLATPVYRADAMLQIEQQASPFAGLSELGAALGQESPVEGEIEIIRSRSVVVGAIEQLGLQIVVEPRRLPVFGGFIARRHSGLEPGGFGPYAHGGERVVVSRLEVPPQLLGEPLRLTALDGGRYRLNGVEGRVGEQVVSNGLRMYVEELHARPGSQFFVTVRSIPRTYESLRGALRVSQRGRNTGILELSLEGEDPRHTAEVLNAIASVYLRQNVERRSEEASQTLAFINEQLPELKSNLDAAESRLNQFRTLRGSVDLTLETRGVLEQVATVEARLSEFELQRAELRQRYTESHPTVQALNQQIGQLQGELDRLNQQIRGLPETERESVGILRDVRVANELYMLLLNRAQELRVMQAGTVGNARIVDAAIEPWQPVRPRKALVVLLSLVLGGFLGVVVAFVRRALNRGVEDPAVIERELGVPVYATIPHSDVQDEVARKLSRNDGVVPLVLANAQPQDLAVEAIRALRTALQFAMMDAPNNIVAVGGPVAAVGKSFVSVNLAAVLADAGKRVLLVDADLRRGHLNAYYGLPREGGLSQVISGELSLADALQRDVRPGIDFLPTGVLPPNPSELLLHARFRDLLDEVSGQYDAVIVDVPPVLAVTDAAIVGRLAGTNFLVLRFGEHTVREIALTLKRLEQAGVRVQGMVMNAVTKRANAYGYKRYGYQYAYSYGESPPK